MSKAIISKLDNGWQLSVNNSGNYFITSVDSLQCISEERAKRLIKKGYECVDHDATEYWNGEYRRKLRQEIDRLFETSAPVTLKEYQMY